MNETTYPADKYPLLPAAFEWIYEFPSPTGGIHRKMTIARWNGRESTKQYLVYTADQMRSYADATCALRGAQKESGWRPIETAPKDGKHILLAYAPDETHEDGFVSQGYWMESDEDGPDNMGHDAGFVDVHFDFFRCARSFGAEKYQHAGTQPTHWQPLPSPPTPEGVAK